MKRSSASGAVRLAGVSSLAIMAGLSCAKAQSVDYGALEQLYSEPVTTSATGKPQKASEAPANITIINADDIRRSGAKDIPGVLRFVTGVDVRDYGAAQQEVAVGGYNQAFNPRMLVMVNGRQVYIDTYGFVVWSAIPVQLEEIRQIEVVKGPATALFGFNAAAGVINIITYDPLFDTVNTGTLRLGSQALMQGSAVTTLHFGDNAGVRLSAGGLQQHEYTSAVAAPVRNPNVGTINIDSKARVAPGIQVTLEASMVDFRHIEVTPFNPPDFSTYHTNSVKAGVLADTAWGTFAVNAYRNWAGQSVASGGLSYPVSNTVYVLQASDTLKINGDNTIRIGLEYRNNALNSAAIIGGTVGYAVYSASGMWDWQITPALSLTNSVRIDYLTLNYSGTLVKGTGYTNAQYNNTTIAAPSFNSGLVYKLTDLDTLRLTGGRGLQVPSLTDFGLSLPPGPLGPFSLAGSPTLQPTAVWNLELGYDRSIPTIGSTIRSGVFVQRNDRLLTAGISVAPTLQQNGTVLAVSQNTGYSDAVGGELGIKGQSESGFRWNASYTFEAISDHTTINKTVRTSTQNYQDGTPVSVVIVGAGYTWEKLEVDAQGRWQSRFTDYKFSATGLAPVYVSDYITSVLRVGYNLTDHLTLAVAGQQLNVSRLVETSGPPVERSVIASLTAHF